MFSFMKKLEIGMKIHYHPWKNKKNIGIKQRSK
jgi:hypothetical protein